jgi:hypothetical protein
MIRSPKLQRAAKDQDCMVRIVGVCNGDSATTVLAHLPDPSHGMALKAHDILGVWACSACHDQIDRRATAMEFSQNRDWYLRMALQRTLVALVEQGVIQ